MLNSSNVFVHFKQTFSKFKLFDLPDSIFYGVKCAR